MLSTKTVAISDNSIIFFESQPKNKLSRTLKCAIAIIAAHRMNDFSVTKSRRDGIAVAGAGDASAAAALKAMHHGAIWVTEVGRASPANGHRELESLYVDG